MIGIDLGTTNCTLAHVDGDDIVQLPIPQRISEQMEGEKPLLPSFYFFPLEGEACVGWYAKERGSELPDRLISSAKSWLCQGARAPVLPLSDFEEKRSAVEVCSALLSHLKSVAPAHEQVLVTVPASFDPAARELVQEACAGAGLSEAILLEEPLAAFYAWLHRHEESWRDHLDVGDTVLVVDIGGGTTDFSLISVEEREGDLHLERKSVGDHLLLGGDNIDLTLAYLAKKDQELDEWQFQALVHAARGAKEQLLGENPPESVDISIAGRGSSLIGASLTFTLHRHEVETTLVDGFFPHVPLDEPIRQQAQAGISTVALPYARDPRITAHLAHFVKEQLPTAVLFNGGTMKATAFQKRLLEVLTTWRGEEVKALPEPDFDFGVSRGAVYYGKARSGDGIRVRAGVPHNYFIGVEGAAPAVPGVPPQLKKVCVVPQGMEEGSEHTLEEETFALTLDEHALFRFFCEANELHPIETVLHAQGEEGNRVLVKLTAKVTELGILELWCVAEDGRKWKLEFNIRAESEALAASS